ncbi:PAS domain S-box protein [Bernardetia sp. ABR2-2B]|uniref:PAS domain S-box protein n=1 Tax=Bernardetia sp. ABR2-2B TaxID=3127472 RepID=UPI0030CBCFDC
MLNRFSIRTKITIRLIVVVLMAAFVLSWVSYDRGKEAVEQRYWQNLKVINKLKSKEIQGVFSQISSHVKLLQEYSSVLQSLRSVSTISESKYTDTLQNQLRNKLNESLLPFKETYDYPNLVLVNKDGRIIYKTNSTADYLIFGRIHDRYQELLTHANDGIYFNEPRIAKELSGNPSRMEAIAPIYDPQQNYLKIGYIIVELDMEVIYNVVEDKTGLGETGEIVLGRQKSATTITILNELKTQGPNTPKIMGDGKAEALEKALKEKTEGYEFSIDYKGDETLATWNYIEPVGWGMVTQVNKSAVESDLNGLVIAFILTGVVIIVVAGGLSFIFSTLLTRPIERLQVVLGIVAKGELPKEIKKETNDEIGQMTEAVNNLVQALKRTADFAYQIGKGNYKASFKPMGNNDTLGNALITMRDSIQDADSKDKQRNWIVSGVAEVGQILREYQTIELLSEKIIAFITEKINAVQGSFYIVEEDEITQESTIEISATYAYHKRKYLKKSFRFAEGLVGQAAIEQDIILRTEIPDNYMTISSGLLGEQKPKALLIVPLITDEKVFGVMEFAGFSRFTDTEVNFVREISIIIARTIFNIKVNDRTVSLLQESQQMSEELQLQQEVLRQNAEEMESTQEELRKSNARLEEQVLEVNRTQKRMQVLLENASEVITIYEKNGKVRYISPSIESILGYEQSELIGTNDVDNVQQASKEAFRQLFENLLEHPDENITIQYEYRKKNGDAVWLEATGTNRLSDPAIRGIVINSRDITERRRAEQESRMRGQMQALSENSPDLIMRLNPDGKIFYVNPTIKNLTGLEPSTLTNKMMKGSELPTAIVKRIEEITEKVNRTGNKVLRELEIDSVAGQRVMQTTAIPEYNDQAYLESILVVSHDITERKRTEFEVRETNRKISESINYARRIQGAILPESRHLQSIFPDSFIFYKPRDIVSGDFPWYVQKGDDVYIAAVDCTGHGVPGALISLIGYFILNEILSSSQTILSPAQILDRLNKGVAQTLRQDTEGNTKDGMDIALCRINRKQNKVEFAGAHRPLYVLPKEGNLIQIKGDRKPIGGGAIYSKSDDFSNHNYKISKGDSLYIFSDGLPDQFGGEEDKKFSAKQIREILVENRNQNMEEMHITFENRFEQWMGNSKQIDDILMIGIKF